jgi:hypothetical protein
VKQRIVRNDLKVKNIIIKEMHKVLFYIKILNGFKVGMILKKITLMSIVSSDGEGGFKN